MPSTALALVALLLASAGQPTAQTAPVQVTQSHLTPRCLDGAAVATVRRWQLPAGEHSMVLTTKNEPRSGVADADPGLARIRFTIEPTHRYEIEIRGAETAYSARVWQKGEWRPVVRDRTTDRIVSGEAEWVDGCSAARR